jgi:hypothetical protein
MSDKEVNIAGQICAVLPQSLNWDELNPQQRMVIINAAVPQCFPPESRRSLAARSWAEIHPRTQLALSTVSWDRVISGVLQ